MNQSDQFDQSASERVRWRAAARAATERGKYCVFRLIFDASRSLDYSIEYSWQSAGDYLTLSHSWSDRTGPGDSIRVDDLAPWSVTMSPSKTKLFKWLYELQERTSSEEKTAWFWLDLFCIDQSWEDEQFSASQIQQIPGVFGEASGCFALFASRPCPLSQELDIAQDIPMWSEYPDSEWEGLLAWTEGHHEVCQCTPLIDAWMTRVWTRQELLYSKNIVFCPATEWLDPSDFQDPVMWHRAPSFNNALKPTEGLRELAHCLFAWAEKNMKTWVSAGIASVALALIKGQSLAISLPGLPDSLAPAASLGDWFAFNWSLILNGSIRRTTWAVDAILSQMLLLPGYEVPPLPRSMALEEVAHNASIQFRRLIKTDQLIPRNIGLWDHRQHILKRCMQVSTDQPLMAQILEAIGSPHKISLRGYTDMKCFPPRALDSGVSLIAFRPLNNPAFEIVGEIDIVSKPIDAIDFFCSFLQVWKKLKHHAMEIRTRERMEELEQRRENGLNMNNNHIFISRSLRDIVRTMLETRDGDYASSSVAAHGEPCAESGELPLPPLRGAKITYDNSPGHVSIVVGEVPVGTKGQILSLGRDRSHGNETGIIANYLGDNEVELRGFGLVLLYAAGVSPEEEDNGFFAVRACPPPSIMKCADLPEQHC